MTTREERIAAAAVTAEKQYHELKAKHPDALLLFRCGDFYEAYKDDAEECAHILGLTLSKSDIHGLLTGFPHHSLDIYLPKLIRAGKRVAICDQIDTPKATAKRGETEQPKSNKLVIPSGEELAKNATRKGLKPYTLYLTKKQYELLCECIRYRIADNQMEKAEATKKGLLTAWYDATAADLEELKTIIYK